MLDSSFSSGLLPQTTETNLIVSVHCLFFSTFMTTYELPHVKHVAQSRVEIENYSIAYFDHIAAFEVLYC